MIRRYRKRSVEVQAIQWEGNNIGEVQRLSKGEVFGTWIYRHGDDLYVITLAGDIRVEIGDYLIIGKAGEIYECREDLLMRGEEGEIYPCKKEIFERTYKEEV